MGSVIQEGVEAVEVTQSFLNENLSVTLSSETDEGLVAVTLNGSNGELILEREGKQVELQVIRLD